MICFLLTLIEIFIFRIIGIEVSDFATQQIITTGANVATSFGIYGWKERIFNLTRLKMELVKWLWEFKESHKLSEEQFNEVKEQTQNIDSAIDNRIDGVIEETINEDIKVSGDI